MKAISRSSRLVAALAAATGLLLTGCSTGAGQPNAAAIISDRVIPVAEVQRRIDEGLAAQDPKYLRQQSQNRLDVGGRNLLSMMIRLELLERLAKREGIQVDDAAVDAEMAEISDERIKQEGHPAYDRRSVRELLRAELLSGAIGKKYANRTSVVADIVVTGERADALAKAKQMAKGPAASAQVVKDESAKRRQANANARFNFWQASQAIAVSPMFATAAGTVVAFPVADDSGQMEQQTTPTSQWVVAYVHKRETNASGAPAQTNAATQAALNRVLGLSMASLYASEIGMQVSPRYGTWDLTNAQLVPNALEKAAVQLKAAPTES
ncbi:SurA N-terminal domain-containing protein [Allokutzneria sp. A3M-2-11 16]|uniref:SurA N-terminal domain-containing protein n=1 Tax=Allokutzneria sp. A3M-2-11 16 TaxID=2962043 RepID=UPI0020B8D820|nr:SurA N-terminal domain-containing protein [Allokutzneria sp. A3M-2-11 16]MCP3798739.1 SurA N-terminal domain-containing protein [Allokutzneria sp. A3M-2-11 16]